TSRKHIARQAFVTDVAGIDLLRPTLADGSFDRVRSLFVEQQARVHRGRIGYYPQPEACGSAAVRHRLAHIHRNHSPDRPVTSEKLVEEAAHRAALAGLRWHDQRLLAASQR